MNTVSIPRGASILKDNTFKVAAGLLKQFHMREFENVKYLLATKTGRYLCQERPILLPRIEAEYSFQIWSSPYSCKNRLPSLDGIWTHVLLLSLTSSYHRSSNSNVLLLLHCYLEQWWPVFYPMDWIQLHRASQVQAKLATWGLETWQWGRCISVNSRCSPTDKFPDLGGDLWAR